MTTATDIDALVAAVDMLLSVAPPGSRESVGALRDRVHERRLRVLVAGEAKRGKSTVLNRVIGRDVLPTGVLPVTAVATTVHVDGGAEEHIEVRFVDGREETHPLATLSAFASERENPENRRGVSEVVVILADAADGVDRVELIDTPGTGSVLAHNTDAARRAYDGLDAVLVVLGADPPVSAAEAALLTEVATLAVRTFVLVNKTDQLDPDELAQTVEFTQRVVDHAAVDARVWPVSARIPDQSLTEFLSAFRSYLLNESDSDVLWALARHAARLASRLRDETTLALAASSSSSAEHRGRVGLFAASIESLAGQTAGLRDGLDAAQRRAIRELTADASRLAAQVVARATDTAASAYDCDTESGPAVRETESRSRAVEATLSAVEAWRDARAQSLQRELQRLADNLNRDVEQEVAELRDNARNLLGVALTLPFADVELLSNRPFWYATDPPMRWDLPGAQLARYHGPGAVLRARRRLVDQVALMADQQVGRARSDLQQRFTDTVRHVTSQLTRTRDDLLTQLCDALALAEDIVARDSDDAGARRERLADRAAQLTALLAEFASFGGGPAPSRRASG